VPKNYLRFLRYLGVGLVTLASANCLLGGSLGYEGATIFGRVAWLALGVGLPWMTAWLAPVQRKPAAEIQDPGCLSRKSYGRRLAFSYLWAVVVAALAYLFMPLLLMALMDAGVI